MMKLLKRRWMSGRMVCKLVEELRTRMQSNGLNGVLNGYVWRFWANWLAWARVQSIIALSDYFEHGVTDWSSRSLSHLSYFHLGSSPKNDSIRCWPLSVVTRKSLSLIWAVEEKMALGLSLWINGRRLQIWKSMRVSRELLARETPANMSFQHPSNPSSHTVQSSWSMQPTTKVFKKELTNSWLKSWLSGAVYQWHMLVVDVTSRIWTMWRSWATVALISLSEVPSTCLADLESPSTSVCNGTNNNWQPNIELDFMNSSTFRLPTSHLFIKLHHLLSLINLKSFKGNNISNTFYLVSSTMGITFSHQTTSNDFARKNIPAQPWSGCERNGNTSQGGSPYCCCGGC